MRKTRIRYFDCFCFPTVDSTCGVLAYLHAMRIVSSSASRGIEVEGVIEDSESLFEINDGNFRYWSILKKTTLLYSIFFKSRKMLFFFQFKNFKEYSTFLLSKFKGITVF